MSSLRKFRGERLWLSQQAICTEMWSHFRRFFTECATHEDILEWRTKYVFDTERWQRLTLVYKARVEQCFQDHIDRLNSKFFWTMWMPDNPRWLCFTAADHPKWDANVRSLAEGSGAHCYLCRVYKGAEIVHPRLVIPWTAKERADDVSGGRLTPEQLDIVTHPYKHLDLTVKHYWPSSKPNGRLDIVSEEVDRVTPF